MKIEDLSEVLRQHPFLAGLSEEHMSRLIGCASNLHAAEGTYLVREGELATSFFLIRAGRIALEVDVPPRGSLRIQTVGAGEVMGWSWLVSPHRWRFSAHVVADLRAIALDGTCLRTKCAEDHEFGYEMLNRFTRIMERRLEATRLQLIDLYGTTVEVRE